MLSSVLGSSPISGDFSSFFDMIREKKKSRDNYIQAVKLNLEYVG